MNDINFLRKSLFKKLSAFKVIYFVSNTEENETLTFHVYCMFQKTLTKKKKKTDMPNLLDTTVSFILLLKTISTLLYLHGLFYPEYQTVKKINTSQNYIPYVLNRTIKFCISG